MHRYVLLILTMMGKFFIEFYRLSVVYHRISCRLDDLLVGAPLYTVKKDARIIPDAGRVVIYHQTPEVSFHIEVSKELSIDFI